MTRSGYAFALFVACVGCGSGESRVTAKQPTGAVSSASAAVRNEDPLKAGQAFFDASRYKDAEAAWSHATGSEASLGLARVLLMTGRYDDAAQRAQTVASDPLVPEAACVRAEALRRQGKVQEAETALRAVVGRPGARRATLLLGEVLLEQGRESDAEAALMKLVQEYNDGGIPESDGASLAIVGRAAHLLGSPQDANEAFNQAERATQASADTLLYRAELFLDAYDEGHAEEVLGELLSKSPNHPEGLVWMAQVKLAQNLDFETADRLAQRALSINPKLAGAYLVRAGIALRDLEFDRADGYLDKGLSFNSRDLPLLSMRAAVRFLADDSAGFEAAKRSVLDKNPRYSEMYRTIGDYADWEHRYVELVALMREGLTANAGDPKLRAQLGLNLIRIGDEKGGVAALKQAFEDDPFNVRAYNTLDLFEKAIPTGYHTQKHGPFIIRYQKEEEPILQRYVPELLDRAWGKFKQTYGFTPTTPVGIELYPDRAHFAIRTSGLPNTFIQGVCFGQTLAAMSPGKEHFNFGMTLWHELAHIFHIQLSGSRVPRWFTEGLAEYETLVERPEWQREEDLSLYDAMRLNRLPRVAAMNEAFSHARDMEDMGTAYYGSTQIVTMIAERHGRDKLRKMLDLWRAKKRTPQVIQEALGVGADALDAEFRAFVSARTARYTAQFVPFGRPDDVDVARERAEKSPKDATAQTRLAHAFFAAGEDEHGNRALAAALTLDPKQPDAIWLAARRALDAENIPGAEERVRALMGLGHDGYAVQMALAQIAAQKKDLVSMRHALEAAHHFDPIQAEPLARLARLLEQMGDRATELDILRKLAVLEQHDSSLYRALLHALLDAKRPEEAVRIGASAVYVDLEGLETHALYAEALEQTGDLKKAAFELETAALCPGSADTVASVQRKLDDLYRRLGRAPTPRLH